MKIDEVVRGRRAVMRLSQEDVAMLAGLSRATVVKIEADDRSVSLDAVARVLQVLQRGDLTIEELSAAWGVSRG